MGVITDRYVGKDGYIRGCKVRVLTKAGKIRYLNRPVNKLYPLEIQSKNEEISASENGGEEASVSNVPTHEIECSRKAKTRISEREVQLLKLGFCKDFFENMFK